MSRATSIEAEGGTIDEAVECALASLGVERADVEVEVLANPSRGLFGLGGRKARVKVTCLDVVAERLSSVPREARPKGDSVDEGRARSDAGEPRAAASRPSLQERVNSRPNLATAVIEHSRDLLEDLLRRMGLESTVAIDGNEDGPLLQITGDNTNMVIGKHGQTLDALEYLLNRVVSREEEAAIRIHVDCEQYRVKRQRWLEQLAQRMADQAKRKGRSVTLDPMSPRDRRIVHLALQGDPKLTTRSSGEGYFRKLVIIPEGERGRSRPRAR